MRKPNERVPGRLGVCPHAWKDSVLWSPSIQLPWSHVLDKSEVQIASWSLESHFRSDTELFSPCFDWSPIASQIAGIHNVQAQSICSTFSDTTHHASQSGHSPNIPKMWCFCSYVECPSQLYSARSIPSLKIPLQSPSIPGHDPLLRRTPSSSELS